MCSMSDWPQCHKQFFSQRYCFLNICWAVWNVLCSLLYRMWNVLWSLLYIMWNVLYSLLYIMWNVLYSLLYVIKCWMERSAVLRTLVGIFPWLIMKVIKFLLIDTGFEMCHVCFASPRHFRQILRHCSPAETDCTLSMTSLWY